MKQTVKQAEKLEKILNWLMGISIALMGLASTIMSVAGLAGFALPPVLLRVLGIVSLLSLPVLVYSTVKKLLAARQAVKLPSGQAAPAEKKPNLGAAASNGAKKPKKKKRRK